jgi:uncharacterized membrane protein YesL
MLNSIFNPDNLFFRILARGVDLVGLSIVWIFLCLPVVTIGPATAALYYTTVKVFRQGEDRGFRVYFRAFRDCLKRGIPATLICEAVWAVLVLGYVVMSHNISTDLGVVMYMAYYIAMLIPAGLVCYLCPLLGRFEMKLGDLLRTAFTLTLRHLPSTCIIVLLVLQVVIWGVQKWYPVLFMPVITCLIVSLFVEKIFLKYLPPEEAKALDPHRPRKEADPEEE